MLHCKKAYDIGLLYINDMIDDNGKPLTHQQLCIKYPNVLGWYEYLVLTTAIPTEWLLSLKDDSMVDNSSLT